MSLKYLNSILFTLCLLLICTSNTSNADELDSGSLFCKSGIVHDSTGSALRHSDGSVIDFGTQSGCTESISGSLFCKSGIVHDSTGRAPVSYTHLTLPTKRIV